MKKVFIGVLAALMLFAFTACEQTMPTYKNVSYITITQNEDFVQGMDFDASKFSVNVYSTDGSVSTLDGNGIVTEDKDAKWSSTATTNKVIATVSEKPASYTVTMYAPEALKLNGVPALAVYTDAEAASGNVVVPADDLKWDEADITGITGTITYNGNSTITMSYRELANFLGFRAFVVDNNKAAIVKGQSYDVLIRYDATGDLSEQETMETGIKATGVDAPTQNPTTFTESKLVSIKSVALGTDKTVWYGETATAAAAKYVVTGVDEYGNERTVTGATVSFIKDNAAISSELETKDTLTVFVTATDKDGRTLVATTTVAPKDYIESISVTVASDYKPANYTIIDTNKLTVKGKWASESTASAEITASEYKLNSSYVTPSNRSALTATFYGNTAKPVQDSATGVTSDAFTIPSAT